MHVKPIEWKEQQLVILDQTKLPHEEVYLTCNTIEDVFDAIKVLKVRGAPLIGVSAAYGILVGLKDKSGQAASLKQDVAEIGAYLKRSRPTAVNLEWAVERMQKKAGCLDDGLSSDAFFEEMEKEAEDIFHEDCEMCEKIGQFGNALVPDGAGVLTHCNAGGLATSGLGTALSPLYAAQKEGKNITVYVDETRPLLQGARLTSYELLKAGIDAILITDNMSAFVLSRKKVDLVVVGADRIAGNGDTANKIGTLGLSILCRHYKIPFYVAAPASTFDLDMQSGKDIPIEERDPEEVRSFGSARTAPEEVNVYNPAFDVTPHEHISAFITDKGIIYPPFEDNIKKALLA